MKPGKLLPIVTLICALEACSLQLRAQQYWQQDVGYKINVSLNDREKTLDGFITIRYSNHSPDTLRFIWFNLWPNAFRNDQTAYSEQRLGDGKTDFYFSDKSQKGYINRLDFRVDGMIAATEDHPQYIDVIKVILPHPLAPGDQVTITTPFHEQLPYAFSGYGYAHGNFQITQWYPKPAVYDRTGWHPMPFADQGGGYDEFGRYDVTITVPMKYVVAATGRQVGKTDTGTTTRTLRYNQDHVSRFAWFADKDYYITRDTLALPSGRIIDLYTYYRLNSPNYYWEHRMEYLKNAIRFRSGRLGEYPFDIASVVQARSGPKDGAGYPTLAAINTDEGFPYLDVAIDNAIGQTWFNTTLGTNGRRWPWMDEGMNAFYDRLYEARTDGGFGRSFHEYGYGPSFYEMAQVYIAALAAQRIDQPISTSSDDFSLQNYSLIAYQKTRLWMQQLRHSLGEPLFDSCMREYYRLWQFKHPYPEDFRSVMETTSHRDLGDAFAQLDQQGPVPSPPARRKHMVPYADVGKTKGDSITFIHILPAFGYNMYDDFMAGVMIHNYDMPPNPFQYLFCPLYAHESKQLNGLIRMGYSWFPSSPGDGGALHRINVSLTGDRFSTISGADSNGRKIYGGFYKIVPSVRLTLNNHSARSTTEKWIEWKTYLIGESSFDRYVLKASDSMYYPTKGKYDFRYLNQLSFFLKDDRVLYPYSALLQFQQAPEWYRINLEGKYFFNYSKGGGMSVRLFAAKFGFIGNGGSNLDLSGYEPKLTAVRGGEDYTYSNYFIGRNEFTGYASQQIMMRDGELKIRTDLFQGLQGRSDNWIAAMNFTTTLPRDIVPAWLPLKAFFDIGTYAEAWLPNPLTDKFLYTGGLQLSLFGDVLNIYLPVFSSSVFGDNLKTVPGENGLLKKLSFSIDLQNIRLHKLFPYYDF